LNGTEEAAVVDISRKDALIRYLTGKEVFAENAGLYVRYFSGGVSCTVAFVSDTKKQVIIKQALPALKVAELWECDPGRMAAEYKALEIYARLTPRYVPLPVFYDEENNIMCREAAPEDCPMWKTQLLEGLLDFRVAEKAIDSLLIVHNETAGKSEVKEAFQNTDVFYNLRINPYIEFTVEKHRELKKDSEAVIELLMGGKFALVHGDYSPKNILVSGDQIFILDMEVAHFGHPAFDLAFFSNHFLLKSIKNKRWSDAYLNMLRYMMDIYFKGLTCMDALTLEKAAVLTLAFLFLARVDGKSPAEYITQEEDKTLIRQISFEMLNGRMGSFDEVISLVKNVVGKKKKERT
jgi:hypothetical protein